MEEIAHLAAKKAVEETFLRLGVDPADPISAQKDFAHLRRWRISVENFSAKAVLTAIGVMVTGAMALIYVGLKGGHH